MAEPPESRPRHDQRRLGNAVGRQARRKSRGRARGHRAAWFGLGMFGLVGWSVAIPTLAGIAQQPDEADTITRTLFVGLAMIESTAIYCFVVSMILIFANPFWDRLVAAGG